MKKATLKTFNPKRSIKRAGIERRSAPKWSLESEGNKYVWASKMERSRPDQTRLTLQYY